MSKCVFEVCHGQSFKTRDGTEKKRWTKVGAVFESDNGKHSLLLEYLPVVGADGKLWLSLFQPKPKEQQQEEYPQ